MLNIINKKTKKIMTLPKSGRDIIRVVTKCRILGIAFMDLRGLMILKVLKALKFT